MYHQHTYVVQHAQGNWASHLYKLGTAKALILFPGEYRKLASDYLRDGQKAVKPAGRGGEAGQGMGWGFDCSCWPWGRAFDQSCSPGGGAI